MLTPRFRPLHQFQTINSPNKTPSLPGAEGAGGARAGVVQLLGVGVHRADRQLPGLVGLPAADGLAGHDWRVSCGGAGDDVRRPVRLLCLDWSLHHLPRHVGHVAVVAVGDDDAVVVADHDDSRHVGSELSPL